MKYTLYLIIIIFIIPVQTGLMDYISIEGIKPDLGLITVYYIGLISGEVEGVIVGMVVGTLFDLYSGGNWGINFFGKSAIGFLAGYASKNILNITPLFNMGVVLLCSLFEGIIISGLLLLISKHIDIIGTTIWLIFPQSIYNCVIGLIVYYFLFRKKSLSNKRKFYMRRNMSASHSHIIEG